MKITSRFSAILVACLLLCGCTIFFPGCSTTSKVPIVGDIIPDLTDPTELKDTAELAGVLVLQNNPDRVDALDDVVLRAERALSGEVITREDFDRWLGDLVDRNISDPIIRTVVRQRFARAWERNHHLLDISGLVLKNAKHRELAVAFISGLRKAVDDFRQARATLRVDGSV